MLITDYSILASLLCFNVFIIMINLFRNNDNFIRIFGVRFILVLAAACVFRLVFAVEFPFTIVIRSERLLVAVTNVMKISFNVYGYSISVYNCVAGAAVVSVALGIILFFIQLTKYIALVNRIYRLETDASDEIIAVYNNLLSELSVKKPPAIIQNKGILTPCTTGLFNSVILLPDCNYTELELYYILKHELIHYINRDVLIKLIFSFITCLLWWNPLVYLLRNEIGQILEIKCDLAVCEELSKEKRLSYIETMVQVLKKSAYDKYTCSYYTSAMAFDGREKMQQRFKMVMNRPVEHHSVAFNVCIYCALAAVMVISYSFLMQGERVPSEEDFADCINEPDVIVYTPENSEIYYQDGAYRIYTNGEYMWEFGEEVLEDFKSQGFNIHYEDN